MKFKLASAVEALAGLLSELALLRPKPNQVSKIRWWDIVEWFTQKAELKLSDKDNVAFTLLRRPQVRPEQAEFPPISVEKRSKARVIVVQGIFNKRTNLVVEARALEAAEMEEEVAEIHKENELVIYE